VDAGRRRGLVDDLSDGFACAGGTGRDRGQPASRAVGSAGRSARRRDRSPSPADGHAGMDGHCSRRDGRACVDGPDDSSPSAFADFSAWHRDRDE
jgi:hypothetical protein